MEGNLIILKKNIEKECSERDLSIKDLNEIIFDKKGDYLSRKLNGKVAISLSDITKIADYFGLLVYELLNPKLWIRNDSL